LIDSDLQLAFLKGAILKWANLRHTYLKGVSISVNPWNKKNNNEQ
jgi:uncharacterized protein YjbI with pentapeptide repeats